MSVEEIKFGKTVFNKIKTDHYNRIPEILSYKDMEGVNFVGYINEEELNNYNNILNDETIPEIERDIIYKTHKRMHKTIKRLREKGILKETCGDVMRNIVSYEKWAFLANLLGEGIHNGLVRKEDVLETDVWAMAIEATVTLYDEQMLDPDAVQNLALICEQQKDELYFNVMIYHIIKIQSYYADRFAETITRIKKDHKEAIKKIQKKGEEKLSLIVDKYENEIREQMEETKEPEEVKILQEKIKELNHLLQLEREKRKSLEQEKDLRAAQEDEDLRLENQFLKEMLMAVDSEEDTVVLDEVEEVTALPEQGVLFIGGHINMVKKIRQLHPEWDYFSDDTRLVLPSTPPEIIFYWNHHASHLVQEYMFSAFGRKIPLLYVNGTNINRLEEEMIHLYSAVLDCRRKERGDGK